MKRLAIAAMLFLLTLAPVMPQAGGFWTVMLDDQPVPAELPPVEAGKNLLLVSARSLCHRMNADYQYDTNTGQIIISNAGARVKMKEGSTQASVGDRGVTLAVAPRKENGAMLVPFPFVAEALGARVTFNDSARLAVITSSAASQTAAVPPAQAPPVSGAPSQAIGPQQASYEIQSHQQNPVLSTHGTSGGAMVIPGKSGLGQMGNMGAFSSPWMMPADYTLTRTDNRGSSAVNADKDPQSWMQVVHGGSMDELGASTGKVSGPDPALTGLLIERRFESLFSSYAIRYRVTNIGSTAVRRRMMVRLLVGGNGGGPGGMMIVGDHTLEALDPGQSMDYEWMGNSRSMPFLNGTTVRAEARIMLGDGEYDSTSSNNTRKASLSH